MAPCNASLLPAGNILPASRPVVTAPSCYDWSHVVRILQAGNEKNIRGRCICRPRSYFIYDLHLLSKRVTDCYKWFYPFIFITVWQPEAMPRSAFPVLLLASLVFQVRRWGDFSGCSLWLMLHALLFHLFRRSGF